MAPIVAAIALLGAPAAQAYPPPRADAGAPSIHDPSLIVKTFPRRYLAYGSHNQTVGSRDGLWFRDTGPGLLPRPRWWEGFSRDRTAWAPDVSFHRGRYWMYYAVSTVGFNNSAIGLATSPTGEPRTWTHRGIVLRSRPRDDFNAIDPSLLVDGGRWWLTFGSFWRGLFVIRLNPATGRPYTPTPRLIHLAARPVPLNPVEGPFLLRRGGWFYLFASFDYCCRGIESNYSIRVGRSRRIQGPYVDRAGVRMLAGGGSLVLASHGFVRGPGGQSVAFDPLLRRQLLVYHYYDGRRGGTPRLGINRLQWTAAGWPYVA